MTRYLRMVRRARWSPPCWNVGTTPKWQGDALRDLNTEQNGLSVYLADTQERIDQVVATLAANRDNLANLDYAIFAEDLLSQLKLRWEQVDGKTVHCKANGLHFDIVDLTADNVFSLMERVTADNVIRVPKHRVKDLLQHAIHDGHVDVAGLKPSLVNSLKK